MTRVVVISTSTKKYIILLTIFLLFWYYSDSAKAAAAAVIVKARKNDTLALTNRFRSMVSVELSPAQIIKLIRSLTDLMISNFPQSKLNHELSVRLLNLLTPSQKIHWITIFDCYQNNLGEFDTSALFQKTGEIIGNFLVPSFKEIYEKLEIFRLAGLKTKEQRNFVVSQLNSIINDGFIRSVFSHLSQRLPNNEIKIHSNCGGRIIMFGKYFKT